MECRWLRWIVCFLIAAALHYRTCDGVSYLTASSFGPTYPSNVSALDLRVPLTISLVASLSGEFNTTAIIPGVQMALDLISRGSLIPGYRLQYSLIDSQCNSSVALSSFFGGVSQRPVKVGYIDAGCTSATVLAAEVSSFYNITQISCVPSAPELEDRERFSQHFQITPSNLLLAPILTALTKEFGWQRMAALQQNEDLFSEIINGLEALLNPDFSMSVTMFDADLSSANSLEALISAGTLFDPQDHVIFLAMYESHVRRVICQAILDDKPAPAYVYITLGWFSDNWWDPANEQEYNLSSLCSKQQMQRALHLSLAITADSTIFNDSATTISGLTLSDYRNTYQAETIRLGLEGTYYSEPCFDAVWAYAIALNSTINDLKVQQVFNQAAAAAANFPPGATFFIENFTYANSVVMERMFEHLSNMSFTGITGDIAFGQTGIQGTDKLQVYQYRLDTSGGLERHLVAIVYTNGTFMYLANESEKTLWPYGVPSDGTLRAMTVGLEVWLTVVLYTLALVGITLTISCIIFTVYFRETKLIRMTSPTLNFIICGGCIVLYVSIFFLSYQPTEAKAMTVICNLRIWLWAIGYSLAFGPVLGKMFRVYLIFSDPKPNAKVRVKDWMLICFVGVLVGLDVLILFLAAVIPQSRIHAVLSQSSDKPNIENALLRITTIQFIYTCNSDPSIAYMAWGLLLLCYKGLVQVVAIFLAFGTRKVKVKGLNDSKYIAAIIYGTSVALVVIIISFAALQGWTSVLAGIFSMGFWLAATMIVTLVFLPKVYNLYKDPKGEHIFTKASSSSVLESQAIRGKVLTLERKIQDLQAQLTGLNKAKATPTLEKAIKGFHSSEDIDHSPVDMTMESEAACAGSDSSSEPRSQTLPTI